MVRLDHAEVEAIAVANFLQVSPIIGDEATFDNIILKLHQCSYQNSPPFPFHALSHPLKFI